MVMGLYNKLLIRTKESKSLFVIFGFISSSCIGSIAATMSLMKFAGTIEFIQLCTAVCITAWFNVTLLAKFSHKTRFNTWLLSVTLNSVIIISHLLF